MRRAGQAPYRRRPVNSALGLTTTIVLYSAAEAPISWASLFFILPHFALGSALLWASLRKKVWLRGMSGTIGLVVQALGGSLFFAMSSWSIATSTQKTIGCRAAVKNGGLATVEGPIVIDKRFSKPGYAYIEFNVNGHSLRTETQGLSCDCGYLQPLGKSVTITEGQKVRVHVQGNRVLAMERIE